MTLTAGTKLGPYEIVAPLGAGGMGKINRDGERKLNFHQRARFRSSID